MLGPKKLCKKRLGEKKVLVKSQMFGPKEIWGQKNLVQTNFGQWNLGSDKILVQKKFDLKRFWTWKNCDPKKDLGLRNLWSEIILAQKILGLKNVDLEKSLCLKKKEN